MESHPLFTAHELFVISVHFTDPGQSYQQNHADTKHKHTRNHVKRPEEEAFVVFFSDSEINTYISNDD
jgi:hypothetical protein